MTSIWTNTINLKSNTKKKGTAIGHFNLLINSGLRKIGTILSLSSFCSASMRITTFIFFVFSVFQIHAQTTIGSWQSHNPMSSFRWVGETESKIYAANQYGVLVYDRENESVEALTKVNFLASTEITSFECHPSGKACIIGYADGNLDIILPDGKIINQPAVKNSQAIGEKSINDILITGSIAWLSSGIGVIQIDLESFNIIDFAPIIFDGQNQRINQLLKFGNSLYMTTDKSVLRTNIPKLFSEPSHSEIAIDIPSDEITQLFTFQSEIYFIQKTKLFQEDTLFQLIGTDWIPVSHLSGRGIQYVEVKSDTLLVTHATAITQYNASFEQIGTSIFTYGPDGLSPAQARFSNFSDKLIVADFLYGGIEVSPKDQFNGTLFSQSSPFPSTSIITKLDVVDDVLYALPGGNEYTYNRPNVHRYESNEWSSKEMINAQFSTYVNGNRLLQINQKLYVSSDRGGVAVLDQDLEVLNVFNDENSPINDLQQDYDYFGIAGMDSDPDGVLYVSHTKDDAPLKIRTKNGTWIEISFSEEDLVSPKTSELLYVSDSLIFMIIIDVGVLAYNTRGTLSNLDDDTYKLLTSSPTAGNLPSSQVTCMVEDLDGEIWFGTSAGIGIIYSPESIFKQSFEGAQQVIVNQDGFNGYLFGTETIEAIAVDGANRKWVGTFSSGLFQVSADGQEQLNAFNTDNSPMLNNKVSDIAILPSTGEVFIASENGLVSFRSDATTSSEELNEVRVFPNPIKPDYNGPVAISNLTSDATVRITTINGDLVFETISLGGQAIWNGNNLNGQRVFPGVYLVNISTSTASGGITKKILFLD